ncbi:MAG: hypothetical protein ABL900_13585 [Burkholderiaceae bacterium]
MNNSFPRLIDGMCATLRSEVLPRLSDDYARSQVFGVINLLNTFKVRADWSAGFLLEQIRAQRDALNNVAELLRESPPGLDVPAMPALPMPVATPVIELLALRDDANRAIGVWSVWVEANRANLDAGRAARIDEFLRAAMRAEVAIELKNAPRPLFAEMSSGTEG